MQRLNATGEKIPGTEDVPTDCPICGAMGATQREPGIISFSCEHEVAI